MTPFPEPVGGMEHRLFSGPEGKTLTRIYTPEGEGPFPVLVYFHGGGWVIATLFTYDASCRALCNLAECIVVSVAYRQAPEHKFPRRWRTLSPPINGSVRTRPSSTETPAGWRWGASAGGNLATVVTLLARDAGTSRPAHQLLVYPVTDFSFDTPSYRQNAEAKPLNAAMMRWFWRHYLPSEAEGRDPRASPLQALDLSGLPPATVITAEIDPLHSEGEAYAARLAEAGVPVEHRISAESRMSSSEWLPGYRRRRRPSSSRRLT